VCTADSPGRFNGVPVFVAGRWDATTSIGYDATAPEGPTTYYLSVHVYPFDGTMEFGFCLIIVNNAKGEHAHTYRSSVANQVIPRQCRQHVREILHHYTRQILLHARLQEFVMETYDVNLPQPALVKYEPLCDIFRDFGYSVALEPKNPGKVRWVMRR
jgi:hypothetical protein